MIAVSTIYHHKLEQKAIALKIEKLERWMQLYRDGKIKPRQAGDVVETMIILALTYVEQTKLLNNK